MSKKMGVVCKNKSSETESLNYIDLPFEVESEEHVYRSKPQEVSKQPYSISSLERLEYQSQEEKTQSFEPQEVFKHSYSISSFESLEYQSQEKKTQPFKLQEVSKHSYLISSLESMTCLPITKNHIQGISSLSKTQRQENKKLINNEKTSIKSVPIVHRDESFSMEKSPLSSTSEEDFVPEGLDFFLKLRCELVLNFLKSSYNVVSFVASGGNGEVFKLKQRVTKEEIAAKIVPRSTSLKNNEIEIWKTLEHPQILPLIETFQSLSFQVFLCPLMETSLANFVYKKEVLFLEVRKYLCDAMRGLNYLHSQGICHLDIKPDNILIDAKGAKLSDFGCVTFTDKLHHVSELGMPFKFRPPEGCINLESNPLIPDARACDLWGFGIMLLEVLASFPLIEVKTKENWHTEVYPVLFSVLQKEEFIERVKSKFEYVDDGSVKIAFDCVHRFLRKSPYKRMDACVALRHPFFSEKNITSFNRKPKDFMWKKTKTTTAKILRYLSRKYKAHKAKI